MAALCIVSQYFPAIGLDPVKFVRQSAGLDAPEAGDSFGGLGLSRRQLASCDFNHDGFDDLAVGIPEEDVGTTTVGRRGADPLWPRPAAFRGSVPSSSPRTPPGIPGDAEEFDVFGEALACGDFDGDGLPTSSSVSRVNASVSRAPTPE